ncbi:hypothetical protein [Sphingopyxis sp. GW247-27LB]|uniref:hypothetical protein n=1 Tax=Sphingopyxis sp. GW247-27LB TaxID=2012632 RepID=UPI000BA68C25|nr:hypothetical protein [Sphingopyxis sp. GW247-27LB]PAL20113.1 hypothetical protein CD928_17000 [Sphingopyxis sp. GW247-27LB]
MRRAAIFAALLRLGEKENDGRYVMPFGGQSIRSCAAQIKLQHGRQAAFIVARQARWARERGNEEEIAFWEAVREDLNRKLSRH